jgi:prevent-host-death family protein
MKTRTIGATEFKAHCLALLDEVEAGLTLTVTKRGEPVVTISPFDKKQWKPTKGILAGKVKFGPDIDDFDTSDLWNVVREREVRKRVKKAS